MRLNLALLVAVIMVLGLAASAQAQDGILGSIEDFLNNTSETLDNNRILGKIRISPYFAQHVVYDDNVFLNDTHEEDTAGREWAFVADTTARVGLVLPVNKAYTKLFERDRLTILSYEARFLEYSRLGNIDSINQDIRTDLFGFLQDLVNFGAQGQNIYFDAGARWSNITDPFDILVRDLNLPGFPIQDQISEIRRDRAEGNAGIGYLGNHFDVFAGYEFDWLDFSDDFFVQANQRSHTGIAELGVTPPFLGDKRVYGRFRFTDLHFREGFLNDAQIREYTVGLQGAMFSKKIKFDLGGGFLEWDKQSSGLLGDDHTYAGGVAHAQILFKPFETRNTRFQLTGSREVNWSAISNFRVDQRISITVFEELMPKKLDADITVSWSHHRPSEGPVRTLLEAGLGLTYHLFRQVDLTARYLFRNQNEERELFLLSATPGGSVVSIKTDGDFHQNVVSLGVAITF